MSDADVVFKSEKQMNEFVRLLMDAHNNTRMKENRGHKPNELIRRELAGGKPTIVPGSSHAAAMLRDVAPQLKEMGMSLTKLVWIVYKIQFCYLGFVDTLPISSSDLIHMCLSLMIEKVQTDDNKALELCRIYKKTEETFDMQGKSSELVYALVYNRAGYEDKATDSIIRYLESCITDETVIPNSILFSPTIKFKQDNPSIKTRKEMILRGLSEDETFSKICENEDVKRLIEKLSSEI